MSLFSEYISCKCLQKYVVKCLPELRSLRLKSNESIRHFWWQKSILPEERRGYEHKSSMMDMCSLAHRNEIQSVCFSSQSYLEDNVSDLEYEPVYLCLCKVNVPESRWTASGRGQGRCAAWCPPPAETQTCAGRSWCSQWSPDTRFSEEPPGQTRQ